MVNLVNMFTRLCFIFTYLPSSTFPPISRLDISHSAWIHILGRVILSCWDCGQTFALDPQNKFQIYPIFADSFPTIPGQILFNLLIYVSQDFYVLKKQWGWRCLKERRERLSYRKKPFSNFICHKGLLLQFTAIQKK